MNWIINRPYELIWCSIPLLILLSIIGLDSSIDIRLHDTYFVIASIHIGILFSIILGVIGFIYWLMKNKKLIIWMTIFHVVTTISIFVLIIITGLIFKKAIEGNYDAYRLVNQIMFGIILIAIFSQLVFMVNLVSSLVRNEQKN